MILLLNQCKNHLKSFCGIRINVKKALVFIQKDEDYDSKFPRYHFYWLYFKPTLSALIMPTSSNGEEPFFLLDI